MPRDGDSVASLDTELPHQPEVMGQGNFETNQPPLTTFKRPPFNV
jgi:hypothetical protein